MKLSSAEIRALDPDLEEVRPAGPLLCSRPPGGSHLSGTVPD